MPLGNKTRQTPILFFFILFYALPFYSHDPNNIYYTKDVFCFINAESERYGILCFWLKL